MNVQAVANTAPLVIAETPIERAERVQRIAEERAADKVQREIAAGIVRVMARKPATTFNVRNEIRAASNAIRATTQDARVTLAERLEEVIDALTDGGGSVIDISRVREAFATNDPGNLLGLSSQGVSDVSSLQRNGRRVPTARGTLAARYELFVSKPEDARLPVKLGEVSVGENQLITGRISTSAAADFFLAPLAGPTPLITTIPDKVFMQAVRWQFRGGFVVTTKDSRTDRFVSVEQNAFSIRGVDLLPVRIRIELERQLADSPDIKGNVDGADGFFQSVTYTFRRIAEPPATQTP